MKLINAFGFALGLLSTASAQVQDAIIDECKPCSVDTGYFTAISGDDTFLKDTGLENADVLEFFLCASLGDLPRLLNIGCLSKSEFNTTDKTCLDGITSGEIDLQTFSCVGKASIDVTQVLIERDSECKAVFDEVSGSRDVMKCYVRIAENILADSTLLDDTSAIDSPFVQAVSDESSADLGGEADANSCASALGFAGCSIYNLESEPTNAQKDKMTACISKLVDPFVEQGLLSQENRNSVPEFTKTFPAGLESCEEVEETAALFQDSDSSVIQYYRWMSLFSLALLRLLM